MSRAFAVYLRYIGVSLRQAAAYKLDFFSTLVITFVSNLITPLVIILSYSAGASIPGYTFNDALLIQSVFMLSTGICSLFFGNVIWKTMDLVREGSLDMLLLKPGSAAFIILASSFDIGNAGTLLSGLVMFAYCMTNTAAPALLSVAWFVYLLIMGVLVWLALVLILAATSFKWVGNGRLYEIFDSLSSFGRYPQSIYKGSLRNALTYVLPVLMLGAFPASALKGNMGIEMLVSSAAGVVLFALGLLLFRGMISLYQSAGG